MPSSHEHPQEYHPKEWNLLMMCPIHEYQLLTEDGYPRLWGHRKAPSEPNSRLKVFLHMKSKRGAIVGLLILTENQQRIPVRLQRRTPSSIWTAHQDGAFETWVCINVGRIPNDFICDAVSLFAPPGPIKLKMLHSESFVEFAKRTFPWIGKPKSIKAFLVRLSCHLL